MRSVKSFSNSSEILFVILVVVVVVTHITNISNSQQISLSLSLSSFSGVGSLCKS